MSKGWTYLFALVVGGALLWPLTWKYPRDSYPLSPYPMFSTKRGKPWIHKVQGLKAGGEVMRLSPEIIAETDEVMQAVTTVARAVRKGKAARQALCEVVGERLREAQKQGDSRWREVSWVEIVSLKYDPLAYFEHESTPPEERKLRARCPVSPRGTKEEGT